MTFYCHSFSLMILASSESTKVLEKIAELASMPLDTDTEESVCCTIFSSHCALEHNWFVLKHCL